MLCKIETPNSCCNIVKVSALALVSVISSVSFSYSAEGQSTTATSTTTTATAAPKSYSSCSDAFYRDLNFIHHSLAAPLRKSINDGRKRKEGLPKQLIFSVPKQSRSKELRAAINYAQKAATQRASEPWLRSDGGSWLSYSIGNALYKYTGQENSPFLCTGVEGFMGYLEPHHKKFTGIANKNSAHFETALAAVAPAINSAWHAAKPVPLPNFAPQRPTQFQNILAMTTNPGIVRVSNEAKELATQQVLSPDHPDLPLLSKKADQLKFESTLDIAATTLKIYNHFITTKTLPAGTPNPLEGTGGDPHEIFANVKQWISGDFKISNLRARNKLNAAMSAMEVAYNVELGASVMGAIDQKLGESFSSIKASHARHCTCN